MAILAVSASLVALVGCKSIQSSVTLADGDATRQPLTGTFVSKQGACDRRESGSSPCVAVLHLGPVGQRSRLRFIDFSGVTVKGQDFRRKTDASLTPEHSRRSISLTILSPTSIDLQLADGRLTLELKSTRYEDTDDLERAQLTYGYFEPVKGHRDFAVVAAPAKSVLFLPADRRTPMFRYIRLYPSGRLEEAPGEEAGIFGGTYSATINPLGERMLTFYDEAGAFRVKNSLSADGCELKIPGVAEIYEADLAACQHR